MTDSPNEKLELGKCSICLNTEEDTIWYRTLCSHSFHYRCIYIWLQNQNTCPICRNMETFSTLMGTQIGPPRQNVTQNIQTTNASIEQPINEGNDYIPFITDTTDELWADIMSLEEGTLWEGRTDIFHQENKTDQIQQRLDEWVNAIKRYVYNLTKGRLGNEILPQRINQTNYEEPAEFWDRIMRETENILTLIRQIEYDTQSA